MPGGVHGRPATGSRLAAALRRSHPSRRLSLLLLVYLLLTVLMAWRLVAVQVVQASEYRGLAARQTQRELELPGRRGKLYDRSGEPLAMSLAASTVYANPRLLRDNDVDPRVVAARLAPVLDRPVETLVAALQKDATFVYLARQEPRRVGALVEAMNLPGIGVLEEPTRTYPVGGLASQVVGFAGIDNTGLSGLEAAYDEVLSGRSGRLRLERAPGGLTISAAPREVIPPVPGTDLVLTLDRQIQYATERILGEVVERSGAKGASAIVLDVRTGEVLAMASVPTVDPERIGQAEPYDRRNRVLTDVYEPGSVNKVITLAAALEEGLVEPSTTFEVPDTYRVGGKVFTDAHEHATKDMTVAEIMAESSNIGTIKIAERLGEERLYDYVRRFGYGRETGLRFPGESAGLLPPVKGWWITSLPTIAIGHGVSATLAQVAGVFQTIASGGEWVAPVLLRGTVGPDGRLRPSPDAQRRRVVERDTAAAIANMLVEVVESPTGTGARAAVPGYRVAGKTGTARKPSPDSRGYVPGAYIASFAGFAPAEQPALVTAVMVDEPRHGYYAGQVAAPAFAEIMGFALGHRRVPPSQPSAVQPAAARPEAVP